jgi:secreted PhoX family phosphatase
MTYIVKVFDTKSELLERQKGITSQDIKNRNDKDKKQYTREKLDQKFDSIEEANEYAFMIQLQGYETRIKEL